MQELRHKPTQKVTCKHPRVEEVEGHGLERTEGSSCRRILGSLGFLKCSSPQSPLGHVCLNKRKYGIRYKFTLWL
jgi:hypothetical protein